MPTYNDLGIAVRLHGPTNQKVKCPACSQQRHNKADKSLSVNLPKGIYNCHHCGWKGHVTSPEEDQRQLHRQQQYQKPTVPELPMGERMIEWFGQRGITPETLQYFRVSESQDWMPAKGDTPAGTRTCINFNYFRNREKINIKYRDALKCFRMTKDAELIFYNLDALRDRTDALICEGEIDCMTFYQSGYYGAVSVPNGASKGSAKLEYLDNCADAFVHLEKITIAVDGDEAGQFLKQELIRRLGKHRCWLVEYPEGCKDANEVWLKYGPEAVRALYKNAVAPKLENVMTLEDTFEELEAIYEHGWPAPQPVGYDEFDRLLNIAPGEVTMVTGIPGHGKDEFIGQLLVRKMARYGARAAVFNFEEEAPTIQIKYAQKYVGLPFTHKDPAQKMNLAQKDAAYKFLSKHLFVIDNQTADLTIDGLIGKATELVLRKGIEYFAIGPYNCIEHRRGEHQTEGEYVSEVMQKLTRFAKTHGVHVFFVAHPTKLTKEKGKYPVPNLYTIAGSANFFSKTDNGLCIYRNYEDNTTDVHVQKVKLFYNGKLGLATFRFDVSTGRYQEPGLAYESELGRQGNQITMPMDVNQVLPPSVWSNRPLVQDSADRFSNAHRLLPDTKPVPF
ncbi:toprim domain-containing protein [Fibrella sp. WM1]|uniref:toprim domain-containing protein n=1 Tax=Fibrella musci TaxID=3242485 RepID=UPI0035219FD8